MKNLSAILALPASLLSLLTSSSAYAQEQPWPYSLPRTIKYYPEHEELLQKELGAREKLSWQKPIGMRKMSGDDGEKFFLHYWDFGEAESSSYNESIPQPLLAPIAPHIQHESFERRLYARSIFARAFKCPGNSHSCSSIGSDLCCHPDQTCVSTKNGVGCCPEGETCGDTVGACTGEYHSCPNSSNGGCCIPGSVCQGTGCVIYGTYTVTTTLPTATKTTGISTVTSSGRASTIFETTALEQTTTETVVITGPGQTTTKTVTVTSATLTTCTSGFHSCPASLGGGCCKSGQQCASDGCPDATSSSSLSPTSTQTTATASQPVRPTSVVSTSTTTTGANAHCPANYYLCSAYYIGCCKIERDCAVLSCPPSASTILETSGVTIVESASTSVRGLSCGTGWFSCPASESGGCCPSGYQCGTSSCVETRGGIILSSPKEMPSKATALMLAWGTLLLAAVAGAGMLLL